MIASTICSKVMHMEFFYTIAMYIYKAMFLYCQDVGTTHSCMFKLCGAINFWFDVKTCMSKLPTLHIRISFLLVEFSLLFYVCITTLSS